MIINKLLKLIDNEIVALYYHDHNENIYMEGMGIMT